MTTVELGENGFVVEAEVVAEAFGLTAASVQGLMQAGSITSRCEKGEGEDEGRWRLTFFYNNRAFRLTVDRASNVISRARFDAPRRRF
jgi:hypothetical protein